MHSYNPDKIVYCPLDIHVSVATTQKIISEIQASSSFESIYRTCRMVPIFTQGGYSQKDQIISSKEPLLWTREAEMCPTLIDVLQRVFFPLLSPAPRVLVLVTADGGEVEIHIDCHESVAHKRQHKLRYALCGALDGLWFLSRENKRLHISGQHNVYIIDGATPHGMINGSSSPKMTVCLGAPWSGEGNQAYLHLLERSFHLFFDHVIMRDQVVNTPPKELFQSYVEQELKNSNEPRLRFKKLSQQL